MQTKWGVSGVNNDQVMKNPPEFHYPQIDGSHNWISEQLDADVYSLSGADKARPEATAKFGSPTNAADRGALLNSGNPIVNPDSADTRDAISLYKAPRSLGSDSTTDAEIAAGKPPSYFVGVKDRNGMTNVLMNKDGTVLRFRPDISRVPSVAASRAPGFTTGDDQRAPPLDMQIQGM